MIAQRIQMTSGEQLIWAAVFAREENCTEGWGLEVHRDGERAVAKNQLVRASNMATQAVLRLREQQDVITETFGDGSAVVQCVMQMVPLYVREPEGSSE